MEKERKCLFCQFRKMRVVEPVGKFPAGRDGFCSEFCALAYVEIALSRDRSLVGDGIGRSFVRPVEAFNYRSKMTRRKLRAGAPTEKEKR